MRDTCRNEWCELRVDRPGTECVVCRRSGANTARIMARVEAKAKQRADARREEKGK